MHTAVTKDMDLEATMARAEVAEREPEGEERMIIAVSSEPANIGSTGARFEECEGEEKKEPESGGGIGSILLLLYLLTASNLY